MEDVSKEAPIIQALFVEVVIGATWGVAVEEVLARAYVVLSWGADWDAPESAIAPTRAS